MEDDHDNASNLQRENSQRFNRQNSWGSFKRKKPLKPLSGIVHVMCNIIKLVIEK